MRAGAFALARGTLLSLVAYEGDLPMRPEEERGVYAHRTGDAAGRAFTLLGGAEAVHDAHASSPASLLAGVAAALR